MGGSECCIKGCGCSSHDNQGTKLLNGLTFYCFPAWRTNEGGHISELTRRRRAAWVAAVARSDITFNCIPSSMRVCSRHFLTGQPAYELMETDPNWAPSQHLDHARVKPAGSVHSAGPSKRKQLKKKKLQVAGTRLHQTEEAAEQPQDEMHCTNQEKPQTGCSPHLLRISRGVSRDDDKVKNSTGKPAYEMLDSDPDWVPSLYLGHEEGKSLQPERPSQSKRKRRVTEEQLSGGRVDGWRNAAVLRGDVWNQPGDQDWNRPSGKTNVSFRDFFRNALEASLEASIRSRAQSKNRSSSSEYEVELNLELPSAADEESSSSSSCLKCVRLQRRIQELERELFKLTADREVMDSSLGSMDQELVLESPEEDEEENFNEAADCVPHVEVVFEDIGEDSQSVSSLSSSTPSSPEPPSSSFYPMASAPPPPRPSRPLRFRKEWLIQFPFLRYSQSQNIMWCHVCRIQSDETQQNHGLIKGSRDFKKNSLMKHSNTKYHRDNMNSYSWTGQL